MLGVSTDAILRAALRKRLVRKHHLDPDAVVVEELPVEAGASRLDMAVINGMLEGIEIKSGRDTLERLDRQASLCSPAIDYGTLVVAPEHVDSAHACIPDWWAIFVAAVGPKGGVSIKRHRRGRANRRKSPEAAINLLERNEILSLLAEQASDWGVRRASRCEIVDRALASLSSENIYDGVRRQLKKRAFIEARFRATAFGRTACGGGITAPAPDFIRQKPVE